MHGIKSNQKDQYSDDQDHLGGGGGGGGGIGPPWPPPGPATAFVGSHSNRALTLVSLTSAKRAFLSIAFLHVFVSFI